MHMGLPGRSGRRKSNVFERPMANLSRNFDNLFLKMSLDWFTTVQRIVRIRQSLTVVFRFSCDL
jgi:hypothetical protein